MSDENVVDIEIVDAAIHPNPVNTNSQFIISIGVINKVLGDDNYILVDDTNNGLSIK